MKAIIRTLLVTALVVMPAAAMRVKIFTEQNHGPVPFLPRLEDKIGEVAGFQVFGLFFASGGFDCPVEIEAAINDMNESYLENEYLPRYEEAKTIWQWLDAAHNVYEEGETLVECPACGIPHDVEGFTLLALEKCARLNAISAEIDAIWIEVAETAWMMVPGDSWQMYMAWLADHGADY